MSPPPSSHTEVQMEASASTNMASTTAIKQNNNRLTFPGTTQIFFNGLMITSGASSWLWLTVSLITIPLALFLILSLNDFLRLLPGYLLLLVAVLYVFTMASAFITAYTDPGILPRGVNPKSEIAMNGSTDYGGDPVSLLVYHPNCPDVLLGKEIVSGDNKIFVKYCYTCEIFRPPRASHCSYCDNCVEEFDHHCPWVSNCVGRRNYRYFLLFLFQLALLIDYAMSIMIAMLYKANQLKGESVGDTLVEYPGIIAIIALCALTGLGVHWLVIYNILLIARDQTTSESIKGYESTTNRTCGENCCRIFFSGRPNRHVAWQTYEPHPVSSLFWKSRP